MIEAFRLDYGNYQEYFHKECAEEAERYDPSPNTLLLVTADADVLCDLCGNRLGDESGDILNA